MTLTLEAAERMGNYQKTNRRGFKVNRPTNRFKNSNKRMKRMKSAKVYFHNVDSVNK